MLSVQKSDEEKVVNAMKARRQRNGVPSFANPDMYEYMTARNFGIDLDHEPGQDDGEMPQAYRESAGHIN